VDVLPPGPEALARATALLDEGELVVVPTDTRYAIAADALREDVLLRLFDVTHRAADRPLCAVVGGIEDLAAIAFPTPLARRVADAHWPGPTALVLKARPWAPDALTANGDTVAIRCPAHDLARDLAWRFGPFAVASLPAQDGESARVAAGVHARLLIDGGRTPGGRHAVVDATGVEARAVR
jgi:L-threonylcarbamoyladenylate synthase